MTIEANIKTESTVSKSLSGSVSTAVTSYFRELKGNDPIDLYTFVIDEVEAPLFKTVMEHCKYNQSRAAVMLGISRGTLRTKLRKHFDDQYVGTREE